LIKLAGEILALKNIFLPDLYVENLFAVPLETLYRQNKKGIIIDLDNTLTFWNDHEIDNSIRNWVSDALAKGFKICIVSNNGGERVIFVAKELGIFWLSNAGKPRRKAFKEAIKILGLPAEEVVVIGDQVFTDVLGGNRSGLFTILVVPLSRKEFIGTRLVRYLEKIVLRRKKPVGEKEVN